MRARDTRTGRFVSVGDLKPVVAAVVSVAQGDIDTSGKFKGEAWQNRAWKLWRELGVLHYPTSFMADQVSRVDWNVWLNGKQLEPEQAEDAVAAVTDPMTPEDAARRLALNVEVAGEVYHVRQNDQWKVVSSSTGKLKEVLRASDIAVRGWQADPVNPDEADSAVRSALDIAEEIRILQALSRSQSRNRLAQRGILFRPSEGEFPEGTDFKKEFRAAMTAPLANEYDASAVVPLDVAFPGDLIEKWRHLVLEFPYDDKLDERLQNAIRRLALSLNMPPEILLGLADINHWSAWQSEESTYRAHVEPLADIVGRIFAEAMEQATGGTAQIDVTPDPTELLARRQSVADAFRALELGVVGFEYVRGVIGADEDDKPTEEELALIAALLGRPLTGVPSVGTGQGPVGAPPAGDGPAPTDDAPAPSQNGQSVAAAVDTEEAELDQLGDALADIDQALLTQLQGAAEAIVEVVRDRVAGQEVGTQDAIAAEAERLGRVWKRDLARARKELRGLGLSVQGQEWKDAEAHSVDVLTDGMTAWLGENIDKPASEWPAVPTDLFRQTLAAAGGSDTAVVAALTRPRGILPMPELSDPQGFAVGVLTTKELQDQGVRFVQWRFRYGDLSARRHPFLDHKEQDGRFADLDGTVAGWYPGDHKGCLCGLSPVYRTESKPAGG